MSATLEVEGVASTWHYKRILFDKTLALLAKASIKDSEQANDSSFKTGRKRNPQNFLN